MKLYCSYFKDLFLDPKKANSAVPEIIDLVEKPHNSRCLNPSCEGKSDNCSFAPDFILSFYRVKRSNSYKEEVCNNCYLIAVKTYDELCASVMGGQMMLQVSKKTFWQQSFWSALEVLGFNKYLI